MHLMSHYNIVIPWILAAQREVNHQKLQHASRPWITKSPSQIEAPHIQLGYLYNIPPIDLRIQK